MNATQETHKNVKYPVLNTAGALGRGVWSELRRRKKGFDLPQGKGGVCLVSLRALCAISGNRPNFYLKKLRSIYLHERT